MKLTGTGQQMLGGIYADISVNAIATSKVMFRIEGEIDKTKAHSQPRKQLPAGSRLSEWKLVSSKIEATPMPGHHFGTRSPCRSLSIIASPATSCQAAAERPAADAW